MPPSSSSHEGSQSGDGHEISYASARRDLRPSLIYGPHFTPANLSEYQYQQDGNDKSSRRTISNDPKATSMSSEKGNDKANYNTSLEQTVKYAEGGESEEDTATIDSLQLDQNSRLYSLRAADIRSEDIRPSQPTIEKAREKVFEIDLPIDFREPRSFKAGLEDSPWNHQVQQQMERYTGGLEDLREIFSQSSAISSISTQVWSDTQCSSESSSTDTGSRALSDLSKISSKKILEVVEQLLLGCEPVLPSGAITRRSSNISEYYQQAEGSEARADSDDDDIEKVTRNYQSPESIQTFKILENARRGIRKWKPIKSASARDVVIFLVDLNDIKQSFRFFYHSTPIDFRIPSMIPRIGANPVKILGNLNHLANKEYATTETWRAIRANLPSTFKRMTFSNDVWSIDTTFMPAEALPKLPLWVAKKPLMLNYVPALICSPGRLPDPLRNRPQPIDPKQDLEDDVLQLLFQTYPNIKVACVLLDSTLLLLHDGKVDREYEVRHRPCTFGGLSVDFLPYSQVYTSGRVASSRSSETPMRSDNVTCNVGTDIDVTYTPQSEKLKPVSLPVSAGLRIRPLGSHTAKMDCLTLPLHHLRTVAEEAFKDDVSEQKLFAKWNDENMQRFDFQYAGKSFGQFWGHFETDPAAFKRRQVSLLHDLALVSAKDGMLNDMPHLGFYNEKRELVEMEWMDKKDTDIITRPIFLLGFSVDKDWSRRSTPSEPGRIVMDASKIALQSPIEGMVVGRSYSYSPDPIKEPGSMDTNAILNERRWAFQRAWIWRTGRQNPTDDTPEPPLPKIQGASGCALAYEVKEHGKIKYRIFGFQNSAMHLGKTDQTDSRDVDDIVQGFYHTYQSLYLPEDLVKSWRIVWQPDQVQPNDFEETSASEGSSPDKDIEMAASFENFKKRRRSTGSESLATATPKKQRLGIPSPPDD